MKQTTHTSILMTLQAFIIAFAVAFLALPQTSLAGNNDGTRLCDYSKDTHHKIVPLSISKSASCDTVCIGDTVKYKIRIQSTCGDDIRDICVVDALPFGVTYVPNSATNGANYNSQTRTLRWTIDKLRGGKYIDLYFKVVVTGHFTCPTVIRNKACIDDKYYCNLCDDAKIVVVPCETGEPHIELNKSVSADSAVVGDTLRYTIIVANTGTATADSVLVRDTIPAFTTYIPNSASTGGVYNAQLNRLSWLLTGLAPGAQRQLSFSVVINPNTAVGSIIANVAKLKKPDTTVSDTTITVVIPDTSKMKLNVVMTVDSSAASPGSQLLYTISVTNNTPASIPVHNLTITSLIPNLTAYLTGSASDGGVYNTGLNRVEWLVLTLDSGQTIDVSYRVTINPTAPIGSEVIANSEIITPKHVLSNNVITLIQLPHVIPILTIEKHVDKASAHSRDTLTYTIVLINRDSIAAENVVVTDTVSDAVEYIDGSSVPAAVYNTPTRSLTWSLALLPALDTMEFSFKVIVDTGLAADTHIRNVAYLISPDTIPTDTIITTVDPRKPKLTISKAVDPDRAKAGDSLTYTITVLNNGDTAAFGLHIVDTVPAATVLIPGSISDAGVYDAQTGEIAWDLALLEAGNSAQFSFRSAIDTNTVAGTQIRNVAYLTNPDTTHTDTTITVVVPHARLHITKTVDPNQAKSGDTLHYTITVLNSGDTTAFGLHIVDTVPSATALVDGSITNGGVYNAISREINWDFATLGAGASLQLLFSSVIDTATPAGTQIRNIAYLTNPDTTHTDTTIAVVIPHARLHLSKSVDPVQAKSGDTLSYTITVLNSGDTAAFGLHIIDTVPSATTLVNGSITNGGVYNAISSEIAWDIATLNAGASLQLLFKSTIDSATPAGTQIRNIAYLTNPDTTHTDTTITVVVPHARLKISKIVDPTQAKEKDTLHYTISVVNNGDTAAFGLVIVDTLPNATTLVNGSITQGGVYNTLNRAITWNIATLGAGATLPLDFAAIVDSGTPVGTQIRNVAYLVAPDTSHTDTTITVVVPDTSKHAELHITKTVDPTQASVGDTLTYNIAVNNSGDTAAFNVVVVDTLPDNTQLVTNSITSGGLYNALSQEIRWSIPAIGVGATAPLAFQVVVDQSIGDTGHIYNVAFVVEPDTIGSDTTITTIIPDTSGLNLVVQIAVDSSLASPNSILTYTVTIDNQSAIATTARNINAVIPIPQLTAFVPASITGGGTFNAGLNQVEWHIDSLTPSIATASSAQLTFKAEIAPTAIDGDSIIGQASIVTPLARTSNKAITIVRTKTVSPNDFAVTKSVDKTLAAPGDTLHYQIVVANVSDSVIDNVVVTDQIPVGSAYVVGSVTHGGTFSAGNNSITWSLGTLVAHSADTLAFAVRINTNAQNGVVVSNQAFVTDPVLVPSNITNTTVATGGTFVISKAANRAEVTPGDTVTYTISYANQSLVPRANVVITDTLNTSLLYVANSATNGGVYNTLLRSITWSIGTIAANTSGSVQFRAIINAGVQNGLQISNVALINGTNLPLDTTEPSIVTVRFPELSLTKTADPAVASPGDTVLYTIVAKNTGLGVLNSAFIDDDLPQGFSYITGSAHRDTTTLTVTGTDPIRINIGNLAASDSAHITYRVAIDASIATGADYTNSAVLKGLNISGDTASAGPASAVVSVGTPNIRVTKTTNVSSVRVGSLILYTITVENNAAFAADNVTIVDRFPNGFLYVDGTSRLDGDKIADPTGKNPYKWNIGALPANETVVLTYTVVVGPSAGTGRTQNVAWAETELGGSPFTTAKSLAEVLVVGDQFLGAIRGKVIVDCDGDGVAEVDTCPVGAKVYLDDGQMSQVNKKGMFYFNTVRAVDHVVALDERSLVGFHVADGEQPSVFVKVNEMGESYIIFRVCLDGPNLSIKKKAAVIPQAEIKKTARINKARMGDSTGVVIDYDLSLVTSGGAVPSRIRVVDTLPKETRAILRDPSAGATLENGVMTYETTVADQPVSKSVFYSLEDLAPGSRRMIDNKAHIEVDAAPNAEQFEADFASPTVTVSVGPFGMTPPQDIRINVIGAQFETSKANLKPEADTVLRAIADSIAKYSDAHVTIEGHADVRPIHTKEFPSNWELSTARAKAVRNWFAANAGVDTVRMSFEGFAATRPVDPHRNLKAYAKNRRVEVYLKAQKGARVDLGQVKDTIWSASAPIDLAPAEWSDSEVPAPAAQEGISRSVWMIAITVANDGPGKAEELHLLDTLPTGVKLVPQSATLNGTRVADPQVVGNIMTVGLGTLEEKGMVELKYEVSAPAGTIVTGGGTASIQVHTRSKKVRTIISNPVRIK